MLLDIEDQKSIISNHYHFLINNPEKKDIDVNLADFKDNLPIEEFISNINELIQYAQDVLETFCILKYAIKQIKINSFDSKYEENYKFWLERLSEVAVYVGAYQYLLNQTEDYLTNKSLEWKKSNHRFYFKLLSARAKSFRNLGNYEQSISIYKEALAFGKIIDDSSKISTCLILIGKVYGNYLGQMSFFSVFIEEAKARLEKEVRIIGKGDKKVLYKLAICNSALGQAYRNSEASKFEKKSEKFFRKALKLNKEIGNKNGISRAMCHLSHYLFKESKTSISKNWQINKFKQGIKLLKEEFPIDERGIGIRYVQLSAMLQNIGKDEEAKKYLEIGKAFAIRHSDYKTQIQSYILESRINHPTSSQSLKKALEIANKYNLLLQEAEINLEMTRINRKTNVEYSYEKSTQVTELFKRNNEIFKSLIEEVKRNLDTFNETKVLRYSSKDKEIFFYLSHKRNSYIREKLLLDFENINNYISSNQQELIEMLEQSEIEKMKLITFQVVNSIARALIHDYKNAIDFVIFEDASELLDKVKKQIIERNELSNQFQDSIFIQELSKYAKELKLIAKEIKDLKEGLLKHLKRPVLQEKIRLQSICEQVIDEYQTKAKICHIDIITLFKEDIELSFNSDLTLIVIKNLLQNSYDALKDLEIRPKKILLEIKSEQTGDLKLGNFDAYSIQLQILNILDDPKSLKEIGNNIKKGLNGVAYNNTFSSNVGFDLLKLIFGNFLGANISPLIDEKGVGIKISFESGNRKVKRISNNSK